MLKLNILTQKPQKFKSVNVKYKSLSLIPCSLSTLSGQSLFEVVVAVGLSALILTGVVSLAAGSIRNSSYSRNNAQATKYAQEALEWLRGQRDADWDAFATHSLTTGNPTDLCSSPMGWGGTCPIPNTIFSRNVILTTDSGNSDIIDAVVTVSWSDAQGTHQVKSNTRFTNWR